MAHIPPFDLMLRTDSITPHQEGVSTLRDKARVKFERLLSCLVHETDFQASIQLLVSLGDASDHNRRLFPSKMNMLNVMARELTKLHELSPERAEAFAESIRKRLLELIQEAKDKEAES